MTCSKMGTSLFIIQDLPPICGLAGTVLLGVRVGGFWSAPHVWDEQLPENALFKVHGGCPGGQTNPCKHIKKPLLTSR